MRARDDKSGFEGCLCMVDGARAAMLLYGTEAGSRSTCEALTLLEVSMSGCVASGTSAWAGLVRRRFSRR